MALDPISPDWLDGYQTAQAEAGMGWFDDHVKHLEAEIERLRDVAKQEREVERATAAENERLRRLLREAYECVDESGSQVLASEIHRALEGER